MFQKCFYKQEYPSATWLSLWESCQRKLTERAFSTLSAPAGHLSQRERQVIVHQQKYTFGMQKMAGRKIPPGQGYLLSL